MPQVFTNVRNALGMGPSKAPEDSQVTQPNENAPTQQPRTDGRADDDVFKLHNNKQVDGEDEVWLMDNIAFRPVNASPDTQWQAEFVLAFFKENDAVRKKVTDAVANLSQALGLAKDDKVTEERIRERVTPFIRQIGKHMEVDVSYQRGGKLHLGPSNDSGIVAGNMPVPVTNASESAPQPGDSRIMKIVRGESENLSQGSDTAPLETGRTYFAQDGGWGVISDIDDTIKVTQVRDRIKLLQNTFANVPVPVEEMPQFYKELYDTISTPSHPAPFVYLSASPYSLYPMLRSFVRESQFPNGMIILRDMSWMDMEAFVVSLSMGTQDYKDDRMKKVSSWLPQTTWVCIGDSTQTDPEAYAQFYEQLQKGGTSGRVARIWIHKVVGVNPSKEKELNDPKRFEKAFQNVPKDIWRIFENAAELKNELEELKKEVNATGKQ